MANSRIKLLLTRASFLASFALAPASYAQNPQAFSLGGQLYAADGQLIAAPSVDFKIQILDATGTCTLYGESHLAQDLDLARGRFNLILGQGSSKVNNVDSSAQFNAKIFSNTGVTSVGNCGQATVALSPGDARQIRISYDLGTGYTALTPDVPLVSSAYAMIADTLQGKAAADFLQVADTGSSALTQANTEYAFSTSNWPKLRALLDGTSTQYLGGAPSAAVDFNGQRLVNVADPTAAQNVATKNYVDTTVAGKPVDVTAVGPMTGNGSVLRWDATANKWVAGTIDTSATGTAGGDLQGAYPSPTIRNDAITAAKIASSGGGINRLLLTNGSDGTTVGYGSCALNQVYAWTASGWLCTNVSALSPVTSVAGKSGVVTLNAADVSGLGTAALKDVGTAAGQIPVLDVSARLPAVDGSLLTNVNATLLQGRTVANTTPTSSQVLAWNALLTQWEPTTVSAGSTGTVTNVASGTGLLGGPITSTGTLSVDVGSAANKIVRENANAQIGQLLGSAALPAYTFAADPATGLYSPGAGQIALSSSGTAALSVAANGNVAIGSGAPQTLLQVNLGGTLPTSFSSVTDALIVNKSVGAGDNLRMFLLGGTGASGTSWLHFGNVTTPFAGAISSYAGSNLMFQTAGSNRFVIDSIGRLGVATMSPGAGLDVATTGPLGSAIIVPRDSTTNRPSTPVNGMLRYNTTTNAMESYVNGAWSNLGSSSSGTTLFPNGTASAPGLALASDPTTGFSRYAPGEVAYSSNGTARLTFTSAGLKTLSANVAVTNSATNPAFTNANDNASGMYFPATATLGFATASTERLRIDGSGNVGIATTAPQAGLDVAATGAASAIIVPRDSTTNRPTTPVNGMIRYNTATSKFEAFENNAWANVIGGGQPGFPLLASPVGTAAAPAYSFAGSANTGVYSPGANQLALATNGVAAVSLNAAGNVGIGTAASASRLTINDPSTNAGVYPVVLSANTGAGPGKYLNLAIDNMTSGAYKQGIEFRNNGAAKYGVVVDYNGDGSNNLSFYDNVAAATRLLVAPSGNVGIATTSPGTTLDVNGGLRAGAATVVTATCAAATEGVQRYNYTTHAMEFCDGTGWMQLPKMAAGSTANVVANGPPTSANTYTFSSASINFTPAYGTAAVTYDGVWPTNGTNTANNGACLGAFQNTQTITYDLGSVKTINNVYLAGDGVMTWGITFSSDGTTFTTGTNLAVAGSGGLSKYVSAALSPNVTARYVRLMFNQASGGDGRNFNFCEFAVGP